MKKGGYLKYEDMTEEGKQHFDENYIEPILQAARNMSEEGKRYLFENFDKVLIKTLRRQWID